MDEDAFGQICKYKLRGLSSPPKHSYRSRGRSVNRSKQDMERVRERSWSPKRTGSGARSRTPTRRRGTRSRFEHLDKMRLLGFYEKYDPFRSTQASISELKQKYQSKTREQLVGPTPCTDEWYPPSTSSSFSTTWVTGTKADSIMANDWGSPVRQNTTNNNLGVATQPAQSYEEEGYAQRHRRVRHQQLREQEAQQVESEYNDPSSVDANKVGVSESFSQSSFSSCKFVYH